MSWCGGGEISSTPGVELRTQPMYSSTLWPGSCPPSPGLEPLRHLDLQVGGVAQVVYRHAEPAGRDLLHCGCCGNLRWRPACNGGSLPRPRLCCCGRRCGFIAIAIVSCASRLMEPRETAPVAKRFTISLAGSTSSRSIGSSNVLNSSSPRMVHSLWFRPSANSANSR